MQEVGCVVVVGNVVDVIVGVVQAVLHYWHCLWTSGGLLMVGQNILRMGLLEEQDGSVVGVFWPLTSGQASSPLSILNAHFRL